MSHYKWGRIQKNIISLLERGLCWHVAAVPTDARSLSLAWMPAVPHPISSSSYGPEHLHFWDRC